MLKFLLHRAGNTKIEEVKIGNKVSYSYQNSIPRAYLSINDFPIDGLEIDVNFTKDNHAIIHHDSERIDDLRQFMIEYPDEGTLMGWLVWLNSNNFFQNRYLYLDIKPMNLKINAYRFIKLIEKFSDFPENVFIGVRNIDQALRFLVAKRIMNSKVKISLQIPVPLFPEKLLNDLDNGIENQIHVDLEVLKLNSLVRLKPDAVHFFHIDSMLKSLRSTTEGHGEYVQFTDWINWHKKSFHLKKLGKINNDIRPHLIPDKILGIYFKHSNGPQVFPNFIGFHNITILNLKKFTSLAKKKGYITISGATNSKLTVKRMISWHSLDMIMVDDAEYLKEYLANNKDYQRTKLPANAFLVEPEALIDADRTNVDNIENAKTTKSKKETEIKGITNQSASAFYYGEKLYNSIISAIYPNY